MELCHTNNMLGLENGPLNFEFSTSLNSIVMPLPIMEWLLPNLTGVDYNLFYFDKIKQLWGIKQNEYESELEHIIFLVFYFDLILHLKTYVLQKNPLKLVCHSKVMTY